MFAPLNAKRAHIQEQIAALEARKVMNVRVGGSTIVDWDNEIAFHKARLAELDWAATATEGDLRARIRQYSGALPAAALACKYKDSSQLPQEQIATLSKIELLEIALGVHPALPPEWRNPLGVF